MAALPVDQAPTAAPAPVHSSVSATPEPGGVVPAKFIADEVVPVLAVAPMYLVTFISVVSVQFVPFHNSVFATTGGLPEALAPPEANAAVLLSPAEKTPALPVFKLFTSVQFVPFQTSVASLVGSPPKAKADV